MTLLPSDDAVSLIDTKKTGNPQMRLSLWSRLTAWFPGKIYSIYIHFTFNTVYFWFDSILRVWLQHLTCVYK